MLLKSLSVCISIAVIGLSTAAAQGADYKVGKDLQYGDHPRQVLDIYWPTTSGPTTPVLLFFHGGWWNEGTKDVLASHAASFAEAGVIFVAANYRLYPEATFPDYAADSAAATAFALAQTRADDGDYRPLFVSGWSAGAYNAALIAYDERLLEAEGVPRTAVKGLIGLSGPYEGGWCFGRRCENKFPDELRAEWNVAGHVDSADPPMLLLAASEDPYVAEHHHEDLAAAARRSGIDEQVLILPSKLHFETLGAVLNADGEVRNTIDAFMASTAVSDRD